MAMLYFYNNTLRKKIILRETQIMAGIIRLSKFKF